MVSCNEGFQASYYAVRRPSKFPAAPLLSLSSHESRRSQAMVACRWQARRRVQMSSPMSRLSQSAWEFSSSWSDP